VIAAVGAAALVAVAVGVALSARAQGRGELASHMEHYSAKKSSSDMDSYFDNLPGGLPKSGAKHRKSHQHHAKHHEHAKHHAKHAKQEQPAAADVANPSKHSSKKLSSKDDLASIHEKIAQQIKAREAAMEKADAEDSFGRPKKAMSDAEKEAEKQHKKNKAVLRAYKMKDPDFNDKMEKVHKEWLAKHDGLPSSKAEKKEYRELVRKEVGNIGDIVTNGLATTYPPGMNKESFEKMKNKFLSTHKDQVVAY